MSVFSEVDIGKTSTLSVLDRLEESSNDNPAMVLVRESKLKQKNLLRLEEVTKYVDSNNLTLREALESIARVNNLNMESFGFSVFPSNLLEDVSVYKNAIILKEEGFPIYINQNPGDPINQCLDVLITEAAIAGNTEEFDAFIDILNEGLFNTIAPAFKNIGINTARNLTGAAGHVIMNGAREGVLKGVENIVDRRVADPINKKLEDKIKAHVPNQDAQDFLLGMSKGFVNNLKRTTINNAYEALKAGGSKMTMQDVVNDLDHKGRVLGSRIGNTSDPRTKNVLRRMYDRLIELKNKILMKIRGRQM